MTGAAIALPASAVVGSGLPFVQIWKHLDIHPFSRPLALAVTGAVGCFQLLSIIVYAVLGRVWLSFEAVSELRS